MKSKRREMEEYTVAPTHPDYEVVIALNNFFRRKAWHNGGPIPCGLLHTERNYRLVQRIDIISAIDIGYRSIAQTLAEKGMLAKTRREENADILIALRVFHQCERLDICQDFIGGIFLLYLELCENVALL